MKIRIKMIDPVRVKGTGPPNQSVDFIPFGQKQFGQVRPVLPGYSGDKSSHVKC